MNKKRLCIWASGNGSNAEQIIGHFKGHQSIAVPLLISSNPKARVIKRAIRHDIPCKVISKEQLQNPNFMIPLLHTHRIDFNALAGFLWKIPDFLIQTEHEFINIHPSLLPKYGGEGMYGKKVYESVIENGETESGISIHRVNEFYDDGEVIFQKSCAVSKDDNAESLAEKIHKLEHKHFPEVLEKYILGHDS